MEYKNVKVNYISLVSFIGEEYEDNDYKSKQLLFRKKITKEKFPFSCGIECPVDDLIFTYIDDIADTSEDSMKLAVIACEQMIKIYPQTFINLYLDEFVDEGNCIDLTIEQFINMYLYYNFEE